MTEMTNGMSDLSGMTNEMTDWLTMTNDIADYDGDEKRDVRSVGYDE